MNIPSTKMAVMATAGLLATLFGLAQLNANEPDDQYAEYLHEVSSVRLAAPEPLQVERQFSGRIEAVQQLSLGFELSGSIAELNLDEGDLVKKGQKLAELDTSLIKSEMAQLSAQKNQTQAQLKLNQKNQQRQEALKAKNFAAEQRLDELYAEQEQLNANLDLITAKIRATRIRLSKSTLIAPFDGQITQRLRVKGAVVAPSEPVLELIQHEQLQAKVGVPVDFSQNLSQGQSIQLLAKSHGQLIQTQAEVETISESLSARSYTSYIRLKIQDNPHGLKSGQVVYATIPETRQQLGHWVPVSALTEGLRGTWNVYRLVDREDDQFTLKKFAVEPLYFKGDQAFIGEGLPVDCILVANGTHRLAEGQRVRLVEQSPQLTQLIKAINAQNLTIL